MSIELSPPVTRAPSVPLMVRAGSRPRRREAIHGVKLGLHGHSGFAVHIFTSAVIVAWAVTLSCDVREWAILLGGLGGLFSAELFHGVLRHLILHSTTLPDDDRERCQAMAAGAMLLIRLTAVGVALLILGNRISELFSVKS